MEFQIQRAGAKLEIGILPGCLGDETQINQVFSNLLDNAVKYLDPKRPGVISVSGIVEDGFAVYAVRDNGIGVAAEHQGKIFEIFHRLNPVAQRRGGPGPHHRTAHSRAAQRKDPGGSESRNRHHIFCFLACSGAGRIEPWALHEKSSY